MRCCRGRVRLEVARRVGKEAFAAAGGAEVEGLAVVDGMVGRASRIDAHAADRVGRHRVGARRGRHCVPVRAPGVGRMPGGIWSMKQNTQWLAHE